jgi:kumamolisin
MAKKASLIRRAAYVPLPGSQRQLVPHSRPAGPVDGSEIASLTIRTRPAKDIKALEKHVREMATRPIAKRKYMSHDEVAESFGADPGDLDAIEQYGQRNNLVVSHRNAAERSLVLTGKLRDLMNAFHADLHMFHHSKGTYRGRQGEILIPTQFDGIITGIFGFDTRPKHKAPHRFKRAAQAGPGGDNGVAPMEFAKRYNFPTTNQGVTLDGSGQCIAIIELGGGFDNNDLQIYFNEIGVPQPNVVAVSVDHIGNHPTPTGADDGEVMLDIEVAGAVAPKATIAVYFAPNQGNGFLDAVNAAVHDKQRKPSVISISWGGPEDPSETQAVTAFHEIFVEAAALGITICVASGDHGTADLDGFNWDQQIHVDHPSVDDLVLSCGGTQIENGEDVVWNDGTPFANVPGGGGWAGGGGVSQLVDLPDYQKNAGIEPKSIVNGKIGRGIPDIAMSATNYFTRVQGAEGAGGGTSAVAPLMAGLVALLNQAKKKNVGFLNPLLYAHAKDGIFSDVTKGTNAINGTVKGYKAEKGWDACSGLGVPNGQKILKIL